ncbi:hypothetical protein [Methylobacterium iners]|uniref:Anti-sigma factor NepR domain-containing protein n=1 Tax=Methylobacterium iners TaxID=418707 RepID=A0ABQ4RXW5_9HYPH|nr:hypothetical protein [Methylobacterium iners]GJD94817.1 hypothetical protein OCOJLMKI_2023 [Methylobacterium iners]
MQDDSAIGSLHADLLELAVMRLFETASGGAEAKALFVADVRRLLADTEAVQPDSPAVRTYTALLRRLGADDSPVPTPEQGLPPVGSGA